MRMFGFINRVYKVIWPSQRDLCPTGDKPGLKALLLKIDKR